MDKFIKTAFLLVSVGILAGCDGSSVRETLGIANEAPDEFSVLPNPPLSVPPDFDLTPPKTGEAASPVTMPAKPINSLSGAERNLLQKVGAAQADSSIRNTVDEENAAQKKESSKKSFPSIKLGGDSKKPQQEKVSDKK